MDWLTDRFRERVGHESGPLQIMYGIDGRSELTEEILEHFEGYRGSAPVRIGNGAADQLQLDIYGELIDSVYLFNKHATPISHDAWSDLSRIVEWVCENWDQADEGIWETRGGRKKFTYSQLMSWVALERAIRIARQRGLPADVPHWSVTRDEIYRQVMERGWNEERQAFVQHYETAVLDASVLLMPLTKFIAPTDPRWLSTLDAITGELVSDSLVYRYDPEASPDGLTGGDGHVLDLHLLVRRGPGARRAPGRGAPRVREDAHLRQPRRALQRGDRRDRRAARQLPAGVHASRADQRGREPRPPARRLTPAASVPDTAEGLSPGRGRKGRLWTRSHTIVSIWTCRSTRSPFVVPSEATTKEETVQYMLLIYGDQSRQGSMSEEEMGQIMQAYGAYTQELQDSGAMVAGDALQPIDTATTVRVRNDETLTTDGPFAETKEQLGGYYLVDVGSLDEALEWAAKIPGARHGSVEVRPVMVFDEDGNPS